MKTETFVKQGIIMLILSGIALLHVIFLENKPPVWGKGDLDPKFVEYFGKDNNARLNSVQNIVINKHEAIIHGLDDKDGHTPGILDLLGSLEKRVKALEEKK